MTEVSDSTGAALRYTYDETGYLISEKIRVSDEAWKETRFEYSPAGKMLKQMVRLKEESENEDRTFSSNAGILDTVFFDRDSIMSYKEGNFRESDWAVTEYSYDKNANITKIKQPEGGCYYYEYDKDDRLIRERHVEEGGEIANEITYCYDKAGNRTGVTDVNGNKTEYEYDLRDRNVAIYTPDGGIRRNVYDKNGNLIYQRL